MTEFSGKVAVVTGSANGIGLALARRFAQEQMRVVLADIEAEPLEAAETEIRAMGATALAVRTDVSRSEDVDRLAARVLDTFGSVHIICNNAGVGAAGGFIWEYSPEDWQWLLGVNLWGVIHGIRAFFPILLKQGEEAHVVNTASIAGILSGPFSGAYKASKHAVVAISEVLNAELAAINAPIRVSVLCPGGVNTRIMDAARNRPAELTKAHTELSPAAQGYMDALRTMVETGMSPDDVANRVVAAIRRNDFYILPHAEFNEHIKERMNRILESARPEPVVEKDHRVRIDELR
jgi:NAD(P)-dependent dehydrogenase (short-subunit alcohol dehydrogenase family)